jgi:hypothetical protein
VLTGVAAADSLQRDDASVLASTTPASRVSPASFARFIGDCGNVALNACWSSARMSVASVTASFPAMNSRARNGESSASSTENFMFHGHTSWEMCRHTRIEIPLTTGFRPLRTAAAGPTRRRRLHRG